MSGEIKKFAILLHVVGQKTQEEVVTDFENLLAGEDAFEYASTVQSVVEIIDCTTKECCVTSGKPGPPVCGCDCHAA